MTLRARILLLFLLALPAGPARAAETFVPSEDFISYMKTVLNPLHFGMRQDRYYPYLTPLGRRIGFGSPVQDKTLYRLGWSQEEADRHLPAKIADSLQALRVFLGAHDPAYSFDRLDRRSQEILLDFAVTEGPENIGPDFYHAVLTQDWNRLINGYLYIRSFPGRPNQLENRAFAQRWIYSPTPLVTGKTAQ